MDKQFNRELFTVDEEKFVKMTKEFTDATKWYYEPINSARVSEGYDEEGEKRLFLKSKSSHLLNGNGKQSLPIRAGIGGVTIGELSNEDWIKVLNTCFPYRAGNMILNELEGEVYAAHSEQYAIINIDEVFETAKQVLHLRFPNITYVCGSLSPEFAFCEYSLANEQEVRDVYETALGETFEKSLRLVAPTIRIRTTGIGGSDVGILLGDNHYQTVLDLYYNKINELPVVDAPEPDSAKEYLFDFGHKMEEFVAEQFEKRLFWDKYQSIFETKLSEKYGEIINITDVKCVRDTNMYRCPECPALIADFDFLIRFTLDSGKVLEGIFECKTSSPYQIAEKWTDGYPEGYKDQISDYMLVGDYDFAVICCAADNNYNNFYSHLEFRDEETDKRIMTAASEFWYNNVQTKTPPQTVNTDVQKTLITYIEPNGNTADFSRNLVAKHEITSYLANKSQEAVYRKKADEYKEKAEVNKSNIAMLLQNREHGILKSDDGVYYNIDCNVTEKASITAAQRKKLIKDRPDLKDLIDSYTVFSTSKSYKISKRKEKKEDKKKKAS